jgi:hypothetical protein
MTRGGRNWPILVRKAHLCFPFRLSLGTTFRRVQGSLPGLIAGWPR